MKIIETSIVIHASAERVWAILTDLDQYVDWNPFIVFASGRLIVGQPLQFRRTIDLYAALTHGTVTVIDRGGHTLGWTTCWMTSTLFNTVYDFTIEPIDTESVRFMQRETLSGLIPILLHRGWLNTLRSYMVSESKALKRLAENKKYPLPQLWGTAA